MSSSAAAPAPAFTKSDWSADTSDGGMYWDCPSPSLRPPRNWTDSAMISTAWRFVPSCASHSRQSSRPSTPTGRPFERYCAQLSPWFPQTVTRSEEHTSELQSHSDLVCRLLLEKKKK